MLESGEGKRGQQRPKRAQETTKVPTEAKRDTREAKKKPKRHPKSKQFFFNNKQYRDEEDIPIEEVDLTSEASAATFKTFVSGVSDCTVS